MCVSYPAPQYILYVLAVIIPDTLETLAHPFVGHGRGQLQLHHLASQQAQGPVVMPCRRRAAGQGDSSRRWKNSPPVSMPCVDVLRPGRKALMWSPRSSTISRSGVRKDLKARSTELSTLAWAMARKKLSA